MDLFTVLFYQPIYNLLVVLYRLFGNDLSLAIIAIAIIFRIAIFPLTKRQIKMAETSREFNSHVKEIRAKYKNDQEKMNAELVKVQSQYLPGQLNGCLALIVQLVLIINIYNVVSNLFSPEGIQTFNSLAYSFVPQFPVDVMINGNFLGIINLQTIPNNVSSVGIVAFAPYIVLALMAGASQYFSTRVLMGLRNKQQKQNEQENATKESKKDNQKSKKAKQVKDSAQTEAPDFTEIMERSNKQTMVVFSVLLVFMSLSLPAGLSLYWTVQSGLVIIQQLLVDRLAKK